MSEDMVSAAGRLKVLKRKLHTKGLSALDTIKAIDKQFRSTLSFGIENYLPKVRLLPGEDLVLSPLNAAARPMLILVPDEQNTGLQGAHFLWALGLRGYDSRDPNHRDWNDCKVATKHANLWSVVAKTTVLMNLNHGPWLQGSFMKQKGEALALMKETVSADSEWFDQFREHLCFDQGLSYDTDPAVLLDEIVDSRTFNSSGIYVNIR